MEAREEALFLLNKFNPFAVENPNDKSRAGEVSSKRIALIHINKQIELIKLLMNESIEIYQSLSTPKKIFIDILNPKLLHLEAVKHELTNF